MKKATAYNEAALPDGSERFYRGAKGGEATPSKGLVFSRDRADAAAYAAKIGGELSYVDVPKARVAELRPAANKPEARVIISAEMARGRRVAEPAQIAEPAPQPAAPIIRAIVGPAEYREAPRVTGAERFYHGGKPDEQPSSKGMVFSRDFADAGRYAFKTGGQLSYVDVAKERMAEVQPSSKAPATRVVVSPALARERQAVPIVQKDRETASTQPMPTTTAEGRKSASVKRPSAAKPASAETVESKAERVSTSKAGGQRPRTASRVRTDEATEATDPKGGAAEGGKTSGKSGRMAALRDKQRAVGKQSPQESGHEM
jgi:hypothetical protein